MSSETLSPPAADGPSRTVHIEIESTANRQKSQHIIVEVVVSLPGMGLLD